MQPHGQGWLERKLIFVAPVLAHAERLQGEPPRPKAYCANVGTASSLPLVSTNPTISAWTLDATTLCPGDSWRLLVPSTRMP